MIKISERLEKLLEEVTALMDCTPISAVAVTTVTEPKKEDEEEKDGEGHFFTKEQLKKEAGNGDTRENK